MTTTDKKKAILRAIEKIQSGQSEFCCFALEDESRTLREDFSELFRPEWCVPSKVWTFFSGPDGNNEYPYPSTKDQIAIRTTALWFFYHMQ